MGRWLTVRRNFVVDSSKLCSRRATKLLIIELPKTAWTFHCCDISLGFTVGRKPDSRSGSILSCMIQPLMRHLSSLGNATIERPNLVQASHMQDCPKSVVTTERYLSKHFYAGQILASDSGAVWKRSTAHFHCITPATLTRLKGRCVC